MKIKILVINDSTYWADKNNNRWDFDKYTKKEAKKLSSSLINCYDCINCKECINCINCIECDGCEDCDTCAECVGCDNCYRSIYNVFCKNNIGCSYCANTDGHFYMHHIKK